MSVRGSVDGAPCAATDKHNGCVAKTVPAFREVELCVPARIRSSSRISSVFRKVWDATMPLLHITSTKRIPFDRKGWHGRLQDKKRLPHPLKHPQQPPLMNPQGRTENPQKPSPEGMDKLFDNPAQERRIGIAKAAERARMNTRRIRMASPPSIEKSILLSSRVPWSFDRGGS